MSTIFFDIFYFFYYDKDMEEKEVEIAEKEEVETVEKASENVEIEQKKPAKIKILWELFYTFFKIGLFTFGGGIAMISLIEKDVVEKKKWLTSNEMLQLVSIAESTPGPIAVNSSTYIGVLRGGILGGICATLGCILPSFIIIFTISFFLESFKQITLVDYAFRGIQAGVAVLILKAAVKFFKNMDKNVLSILIMLSAFFVLTFTNFGVIYIILISAAIMLIYRYTTDFIIKRRAKE